MIDFPDFSLDNNTDRIRRWHPTHVSKQVLERHLRRAIITKAKIRTAARNNKHLKLIDKKQNLEQIDSYLRQIISIVRKQLHFPFNIT